MHDPLPLYPLNFKPVFKNYLWGGHQLNELLNKKTGPGIVAESWEVVDHGAEQSLVENGPLAGCSLHALIEQYKEKLVGQEIWESISNPKLPSQLRYRFPLLIKFLDAAKVLSVQVHPDDSQAARLDPPDFGKTEAWYIVHRAANARIYAGLQSDVTKDGFLEAIRQSKTESCLHHFSPEPGGCVLIPAGTQHAIGAGLLILEVQQASDTTYRVFDWDRVDANGQPRALHIEQAISVTNFDRGPIFAQKPLMLPDGGRELVRHKYFAITEWKGPIKTVFGATNRFQILVVISGRLKLGDQDFGLGQTVFLPPSVTFNSTELEPGTKILQIWIP